MSTMHILPQAKPVKLGVAFIGGCGANNARDVINELDPKEHPYLYLLIANTDNPQLTVLFNPKNEEDERLQRWVKVGENGPSQLALLQLGQSGKGAGGKPEVGKIATEEKMKEIEDFLENLDALILVGGLGGGTGTGALPLVAQKSVEMKIPTLAIVTMPLQYEGGKRLKKAQVAKDGLLNTCPTIVVYNQNIPNKNILVEEAWREVNESCLLPMFYVLREIIQEVGREINVDIADWESVLGGGHYAIFGYCEENGDAGSAAKKLLEDNPFQDRMIIKKANQLLLWFHGEWKLAEIEKLIEPIRTNLKDANADNLEINFGVIQRTQDGSKWVGLLAVADESPNNDETTRGRGQPAAEPEKESANRTESISDKGTNNDKTKVIYAEDVMGRNRMLYVNPELAARWSEVRDLRRNTTDQELREVVAEVARQTGFEPFFSRLQRQQR